MAAWRPVGCAGTCQLCGDPLAVWGPVGCVETCRLHGDEGLVCCVHCGVSSARNNPWQLRALGKHLWNEV